MELRHPSGCGMDDGYRGRRPFLSRASYSMNSSRLAAPLKGRFPSPLRVPVFRIVVRDGQKSPNFYTCFTISRLPPHRTLTCVESIQMKHGETE